MNTEIASYIRALVLLESGGHVFNAYHGTAADFDQFNLSMVGTANPTKEGQVEFPALWFAENPRVAVNFSGASPHGFDAPDGARVLPVRLSMANPLIVDLNTKAPRLGSDAYFNLPGGRIWDINPLKGYFLSKAKHEGHDGVVFRNGYDGWMEPGDIYAVFDPNQVQPRFSPERTPVAEKVLKVVSNELGTLRRSTDDPDTKVLMNPTRAEFAALASGSETVRFIIVNTTSDLYVWNGQEATHQGVFSGLYLEGSLMFHTTYGYLMPDRDPPEVHLDGTGWHGRARLEQNPNLRLVMPDFIFTRD